MHFDYRPQNGPFGSRMTFGNEYSTMHALPASQSGPRLVAFAGLRMAFFRQSKRRTALFLETLLHQPCCPALAINLQTQVTAALRPAYEELTAALPG